METLSAATTTTFFKLPTTSTARDLPHVTSASSRPPPHQRHYHLPSAPDTSRRRSLTSSASTPAALLSSKSPPLKNLDPLPFHRRAASGYAAALLDASQLGGPATLAAVARDVARFSKLLRREEIRGLVRDGSTDVAAMMKMVAERGGFHPRLKVILDLLIDKERVGILGEVLDEFHRIFQLLGHGVRIGGCELTLLHNLS